MSPRRAWPLAGVAAVAFLVGWILVQAVSRTDPTGAPASTMESSTPSDAGSDADESPTADVPLVEQSDPVEPVEPVEPPRATVSPEASPLSAASYVFPVQPADAASYGPTHHDYPATDIFAPCGTDAVAATDGVVHEVARVDPWDPAVDDPATRGGLSVSIIGADGVRYYGSHLESVAGDVRPGASVVAGQLIGRVGRTGNAAATPCHLHFGISPPTPEGDWQTRRGVVAPAPYLDAWRAGEPRSPADEVAALRAG